MYGTKYNAITATEEPDQTADGAAWLYAPAASGLTAITSTPIKAAASVVRQGVTVGLRNYLTGLQISTDSLTANTEIVVMDGSTVIWRSLLRSGVGANVPYAITFPEGALKSSLNTALNIQLLTAPGAGIYVNAQGYTGL